MQATTSYGGHILSTSNPSSTHSSPRSFTTDLEPSTSYNHHPSLSHTYPIPGQDSWPHSIQHHQPQPRRSHPLFPHHGRPPFSNSLFPITTDTLGAEHDPNEHTARPSNAHAHTQFHNSLALPLPPMPDAGANLVTPTATTGSSSVSSMSSAGLSSGASMSSASSVASSFADSQQQHLHKSREQRQAAVDSSADYITGTPGLTKGLTRPLTQLEKDRLEYLDRLKYFLATAPSRWQNAEGDQANGGANGSTTSFAPLESTFASQNPQNPTSHPQLNRFMLPSQEFVTCVYWNGLYHITGTDIVRALVFRFEAFGRPVRNIKKFEEGVFSDLRNLKPGEDACLEEPKSPFLDLLFKYQCIRTQKKQKVFYWFSVPHDRLFLDALDRDLKRERIGQEPTTVVTGEPALSFTFDPKRPLYEQFTKMMGGQEGESEFDRNVRNAVKESRRGSDSATDGEDSSVEGGGTADESEVSDYDDFRPRSSSGAGMAENQLFGSITLMGSRTYKHRKRTGGAAKRARQASEMPGEESRGRGDEPGSSGSRYASHSASRERSRSGLIPPPLRYDSMMEEFGPGSMDERQQSEPNLSAADFFLKQAKGQLLPADGIARSTHIPQPIGDPDVFYSEGAPPPPSSASSSSSMEAALPMIRPAFHSRTRSMDPLPPSSHPHRHSYHGSMSGAFGEDNPFGAAPQAAPFAHAPIPITQTASLPAPTTQSRKPPPPPVSSTSMYEQISADGKVKVFPCPLFSCSRVFKRMEHLKRHLRTHTMERPFACNKCNKRFSRSDNLNQHLRTHDKSATGPTGESATEGAVTGGGGAGEQMEDDSDHEGGDYGNAGDSDFSNPDLGYFSDSVNLSSLDLSSFAEPGTYSSNVQMREYDPRDVQEVQGDEEGLLVISPGAFAHNPDGFYPASTPLFGSASAGMMGDPGWGRSSSSSSSFSFGQGSMRGNRNSMPTIPANYIASLQEHSTGSSIASLHRDDLVPSLSAPSHRADFDHVNMYGTTGMMVDDGSSAGGPIRRHRSMTPSISRNGEPIRRPPTSNSGEFNLGMPGSTPSSVGSSSGSSAHRGYHPYAGYGSSSRGGSAHSSPAIHNVPLSNGGEYHGMRSRGSSFVSSNPMMMNSDVSMAPPDTNFGDSLYRTDSPAFMSQTLSQTESPAPFTIDLPQQFGGANFFGNNQVNQSANMSNQFSQQAFGDSQFYPQHVTTL